MVWSCVLIVPDDQLATGNAVGNAMGWGPSNFSVPLSAGGSEPATHWGLHAWTSNDFKIMIETGAYPAALADAGITQADYDALLAVLVASFAPEYFGHFQSVVQTTGLAVIE